MKQLLILSGKGGTGKTTVASSFIKLLNAKAYADCDVDAPNLHLLFANEARSTQTDFYGMQKAKIFYKNCIHCGTCYDHCRFHAIEKLKHDYWVDPFSCEGCGLCATLCPTNSIQMQPSVAGDLMLFKKEDNVFSTAQLKMGSGTSGKLVTAVKKQMTDTAMDAPIAVIDGSPGIGCPVIASMSGVDLVLIVAEPSLSGMSDMKRILQTAKQFQTKTAVCINKYDINLENTKLIESFCAEQHLPFVGKIPFDKKVNQAINGGKCVVDINCKASSAMTTIFQNTLLLLEQK